MVKMSSCELLLNKINEEILLDVCQMRRHPRSRRLESLILLGDKLVAHLQFLLK